MTDDELTRDNEAAWRRLEEVSGVSRQRWAFGDPEALRLLEEHPGIRAAHDAVMRSITDCVARAEANLDQLRAELERLRRQLDDGRDAPGSPG